MLKQSRLHEVQQLEGAEFVEHRGWRFPQKFTSVNDEYEVLKSSVGLIDLSGCGLIEITGRDRVRFLHGMLTNDIKALNPGQGCYAAMLSPQGRMLADMRVYCLEESFLLTVESDLREKLVIGLRKYIIGDQVQLVDRSEELAILSFQGPRSSELLSQITSQPVSAPQLFDHFEAEIQGVRVRICRVSRINQEGYDLILPQKNLVEFWNLLREKGRSLGIKPVGLDAINTHRIEAGTPWYGFDMDETNLALEAGLEKQAISFTKGCYIGQETVARATYVGHVNRKLVGLLLAGDQPVSRGDKIFKDEREVGWITSSVYSLAVQKPIAMGYLRREVMAPGTVVRVNHSGSFIVGEVRTLPLVTPEKQSHP